MEWLNYANQGATRNQPIAPELAQALGFLPEMGITMDVFSGGQPAQGSGGARVGSVRHDHGNSADVFFNQNGRRLDWANPDDVPIYQDIVRRARANGVTGFGAGDGYMQPGSMHIGFGTPAVWGAGGRGANAPGWLSEAYKGARVSTRNVQTPSTGNAQARGILSNEGNQMAQQPQGLLGSMGIQRRDPNAQGETSQPFYNRRSFGDTLARMAPALGRMGVMGLEGPAQAALDSRNERQGDERAQAMLDTRRNQTREWIASQPNGEQFAAMFDAVGGDATLKAMQAANAPADQTSGMQNYDFLVSQGMDPETAMARAFGAGGTSITNNLGGGGQTAGWEAIDKAYADTWLRDSVVGLPDAANQAAQISGVLGQLENGVALTGTMVGVQPDFIRAITNPTAQDAKDRVEGVVQRSLRETLGAQFTAAEGDRLIARAYNVNLPPELNAARLRALYTQLEAVAGQKLGMRTYFNENGTLQGFNGATSIPTVDDFLATMDAAAPSPDAPPPAGAPNVGDERDGYRFKGGDPSQQSSWERI
jgi:hypothetical protein